MPAGSPQIPLTTTVTSVNDSNVSGTLLAANVNRLGASVYNHSDQILYLKLGSAASTTDFSVILAGNGSGVGGYYEVPYGYTGIITGVWAADSSGSAKVTEMSA